jgi:choline-sulfatase
MFARFCGWSGIAVSLLVLVSTSSAASPKPNIVLVTLDSVRADRVGFLGRRSKLTPNLDNVARDSIIFEQAYSQAPDTVASTATILTGTYPQTHRASELSIPLPASVPYLPDVLHAAGYQTAAFVGSIALDPWDGPFQDYDRGFDRYGAPFHPPNLEESQSGKRRAPGQQVVARVAKWLAQKTGQPFFVWVNLSDAELPSGTPYDRGIGMADAAVNILVNVLRARSLYNDAVIVIASSHGEGLGAQGETTHGLFLYDETIHVPLLVKLPGNRMAGKRTSSRVRLVDIAPTLLELAGVASSSQMQGQSLLRIAQAASQSDQPAYARSVMPQQDFGCSMLESWRAGRYLFIRAPTPELYDVVADPGANHNLAQSSRATLDTMASQLAALDRRLGAEANNAASSGLTSSELQKLASLGYVGLQRTTTGVDAASHGKDPKEDISAINKTRTAIALSDSGKLERARSTFQEVLSSHPSFYLAQYGMGAALIKQRKFSEAISYLHKAIELQPDSAWAHFAMGIALISTGDFKTAVVHLKIASDRLPACSRVHFGLAVAYEHLGLNQDADRERTRSWQIERRVSQ